jgi:site-specific DNA recombinase
MTKAIVYARVSSKEQEREGFSIPAQLKLLQEYALRNQLQVVREFIDIETAKTTGRQNFDEMVRFLEHKRDCRILLVEKTDRLYRNLRDAVTLEDLDIEIHLVKEGQVISKDAKSQTKLIHGMHLVLARHYIENLREEVKRECGKRRSRGSSPAAHRWDTETTKLSAPLKYTRNVPPW